ncbi:MAG: hypothetical protein JWM32_2538 [Verrucomicrobia bacterium]|nr:hypothetical protein [Verrucomicrobiota bacterium]
MTATATATAQALVRIPSINPQYDPASRGEGEVSAWIEGWAARHGIELRVDDALPNRRNLVLTVRNGPPRPHFLFAGHMDTVAVAGMEIAPFGGEITRGRLFGRGSADMKGPLAAMLHALLRLRDRRSHWQGTVSVACVVDEEYLARGIKALMAREDRHFDYAVVGEPTGMSVVNGCKGCLRFTFSAEGAAAHSSTPALGRNAIVAMSEAILALNRFFETDLGATQRLAFGSSTGSIGLISGGTGVNIVAGSCRASVDIRLIPGQSWEKVYAAVQACVRSAASVVAGVTWNFEADPFTDPSFETAADHALVQTALAVTKEKKVRVVAFCCDASKIAAAGVPCIVLGPGDIAEAHTSAESIGIDEIEMAVERYAELAEQLLAPKNPMEFRDDRPRTHPN